MASKPKFPHPLGVEVRAEASYCGLSIMILSMTGYGTAQVVHQGKTIHAEVKSLNSKNFDLSMRLPALYKEKEMELRTLLQEKLERGKVDFTLWVEQAPEQAGVNINAAVAQSYYQEIKALSEQLHLPEPADWWGLLTRLPEVMAAPVAEKLTPEEWATAQQAIAEAVEGLLAFRAQEGKALEKKFTEKIDNIEALLHAIEPYEKGRTEKIKGRLKEQLEKLQGVDYDRGRLEQELIYYIEKLDISEEKQRLSNHLKYFRETLNGPKSQGKKLGFIAQEMGREINTTGSKACEAEMQNLVVKMKDELEQIKEQVLNAL